MFAAQNGHEVVIRLLIEKDGVDINANDKNWRTPPSLAVVMEHDAIVQQLNNNDNRHISDINIIAKDNRGKSVVCLLNDGADVGAKGSDITPGGLFVGNVTHSEMGRPAGSAEYQEVSDIQDLDNGKEDL